MQLALSCFRSGMFIGCFDFARRTALRFPARHDDIACTMIDLFSDTKTRPTAAMRQVMANAEVGDERANEDPSVNRLVERCAALLGKQAALFLPSGTMCNEIALAVHCRPGDEVICDATSHIIGFEGGGPAALAGVMLNPITARAASSAPRSCARRSTPTGRTRRASVWSKSNRPRISAAARSGRWRRCARSPTSRTRRAWSRTWTARACSMPASPAASRPPTSRERFDSVWIDFSKGLGAPGGAVLAGTRDFIPRRRA